MSNGNSTLPVPTFGVVVLTQGTRPTELQRGFDSLLQQTGVSLDVVVVGNGWKPANLPDGFKGFHLKSNVGIPAGRNAGVPLVSGEFLFFLDDDAWLLDDDFLANMANLLYAHRDIGMVQPRIEDPGNAKSPQRWIPRLRKGDPTRSSNAFSVVEMAVVMRREVFDLTSGWPAGFWYAHEGIELAWRVWDAGYRTWYDGGLRAGHPVVDPARHDEYYRLNARNRVWLARRNLPWPFSWTYVASWTLVQLVRWCRYPLKMKPWVQGWTAGWNEEACAGVECAQPLKWSTIGRMARAGRPPVI